MTHRGSIAIGKVVGLHGIKGAIKVYFYSESKPAGLDAGGEIRIKKAGAIETFHKLVWIKPHKRNFLLFLENVPDRDLAEALVDAEIIVDRSELPVLEEDVYYWTDLMDMTVVTTNGDHIGRITSIFEAGANDIYVVHNQKDEILIPALARIIKNVDLKNKTMRVDLPEELRNL
jgi:16S rRNA processing protein RimM